MEVGSLEWKLVTSYAGASDGFKEMQRQGEAAAGSLTSAFDGVSSSILTIASVYVGAKLLGFFKQVTKEAARLQVLGDVLKHVGGNANYSTGAILAQVNALEKLNISSTKAHTSLTKMIQAELDIRKATSLGKIAQDIGATIGIDSSTAFDRLIHGIQTMQPLILKNIGLTVSMEEEIRKYAKANNIAAESITKAQKQQILMNAVLKEGEKISGAYATTMETAGGKLTLLPERLKKIAMSLGNTFVPALNVALDVVLKFLDGLSNLREKAPILMDALSIFAVITPQMLILNRELKKFFGWIEEMESAGVLDSLSPLLKGIVGSGAKPAVAGVAISGVSEMGQAFSGRGGAEIAKEASGLIGLAGKLHLILAAIAVTIGGIIFALKYGNDLVNINKNLLEEISKKYEDIRAAIETVTDIQEKLNDDDLSAIEKRNAFNDFAMKNFAKYPELIKHMNAPLEKQKEILEDINILLGDNMEDSLKIRGKLLKDAMEDAGKYQKKLQEQMEDGEVGWLDRISASGSKIGLARKRRKQLGMEKFSQAWDEGNYGKAFWESGKTVAAGRMGRISQLLGIGGAYSTSALTTEESRGKEREKLIKAARETNRGLLEERILYYKDIGKASGETARIMEKEYDAMLKEGTITRETRDDLVAYTEEKLNITKETKALAKALEEENIKAGKLKKEYKEVQEKLGELKEAYAALDKVIAEMSDVHALEMSILKTGHEEKLLSLQTEYGKAASKISNNMYMSEKEKQEELHKLNTRFNEIRLTENKRYYTEKMKAIDETAKAEKAKITETLGTTEDATRNINAIDKQSHREKLAALTEWKNAVISSYNTAIAEAQAYRNKIKQIHADYENTLNNIKDQDRARKRSQLDEKGRAAETIATYKKELIEYKRHLALKDLTYEQMQAKKKRLVGLRGELPGGAEYTAEFVKMGKEIARAAKSLDSVYGDEAETKAIEAEKRAKDYRHTWTSIDNSIKSVNSELLKLEKVDVSTAWANFQELVNDGTVLASLIGMTKEAKNLDRAIKAAMKSIEDLKSKTSKTPTPTEYQSLPSGVGAKPGLQTGGLVKGSGRGDIIDAKLEPGEYVIKRPAVEHFGKDFISAINNMKLPSQGKTSGEEITLNLNVGGGSYPLKGEKTVVKELVDALKNSKLVGAY